MIPSSMTPSIGPLLSLSLDLRTTSLLNRLSNSSLALGLVPRSAPCPMTIGAIRLLTNVAGPLDVKFA